MTNKAILFDIYRGTTHDGPGMRSTIFFKGCPLSCRWCHNPEGISAHQGVWWEEHSCIGCLTCVNTCGHGALNAGEAGVEIDRGRCTACLECVRACPAKAMTAIRSDWELDDLVREACKDEAYYRQTGGGVTASGGEVLLQADFVAAFFQKLRERGIHTALDTCGMVPEETFFSVLPYTDIILYDLKLIDSDLHRRFCGVDNARILSNAKAAARAIRSGELACDMWIRTPLIPGATATVENVTAIGAFIHDEMLPAVTRWELCAFNNSCINKYKRLGKDWEFADTPLLTRPQANELLAAAKATGVEEAYITGIIHEDD